MSKMPGSLIPVWAEGHAEQALTPDRMTPARYRFDAAVTDITDHASTDINPRPEITPAVRCRTSLASMYKCPMMRRDVLHVRSKACILYRTIAWEIAEFGQTARHC